MVKKILDNAKAAISCYGRDGDNSFECFGINLDTNGVSEMKTYRFNRSRRDRIIDWNDDVEKRLRELIANFESRNIIRLQEISRTNLKNRFKLYFSLKCSIPAAEHTQEVNAFLSELGFYSEKLLHDVENCIASHLSPGRSPMLMLGVELSGGTITMLKAHFTLERFDHYTQRFGEKCFFETLEDTIKEVSGLVPQSRNVCERYLQIGRQCTPLHFYPFMIGINQSEKEVEQKLYFRMKYDGLSKEQILDNSIAVMRCAGEMIDVKQFEMLAKAFFAIGLFMEGFAIGNETGEMPMIKTYFFPLPSTKV